MQDMRCNCTMLEKGAFEGCYARYAINVHPSSDVSGVFEFQVLVVGCIISYITACNID